MMSVNYRLYPTDYIQQLNIQRGKQGRKKSRAFMEYWNDMEFCEHNSVRFYATSWEISVSTAHGWIDEFDKEIDLFLGHWTIKNKQHYNYAQKSAEHLPNKTNTHEAHNIGKCSTTAEHLPNKVFNIYNNTASVQFDKDFEDMYFRCRYSSKYTGNKEFAYQEYITNHKHISHSDMAYAYMLHVNDPKTNGKTYNLTNFMKQNAYMNYLKPLILIKTKDKELKGYYDKDNALFIADDGKTYELAQDRFITMVSVGELIITNNVKTV